MIRMNEQSARAAIVALSSALVVIGVAPASAAEVRYDPGDTVYFTYCHAHPPAIRIKPGDTVITRTKDAANDVFQPTDKTVFPRLDLTRVNPQTGPFFIEGAEPGDTLVVRIDRIGLNRDWGWGASIPYFGALAPEYKTAMITDPVPDRLFIWRFDRSRMVGMLDLPNSKIGKVEVPLRPFFGTIGTAPAGKECISSLVPGPHGANMDFNEVVEGVTMSFPVFEPGALFMLGDGHAAQGDGEVDGAAVETAFDVVHGESHQGKKDQLAPARERPNDHVDRQHAAVDRCAADRLRRSRQLAGAGSRLRQDRRGSASRPSSAARDRQRCRSKLLRGLSTRQALPAAVRLHYMETSGSLGL